MKNKFKTIITSMILAVAVLFSACGSENGNSNGNSNGEDPQGETPDPGTQTETVVFTSVKECVYMADTKGNQLGFYTLMLENENNQLYFEFSSSLTLSEDPMPDEGTYEFSTENTLGTFNGSSYWILSDNGMDTTRRLESGSFSFTSTDKGYKISGKVAGRDETELDFVYEGDLAVIDFSGTPAEDAITCLTATGTYYGGFYIPNVGDYYIVLFDTVHTSEGEPYNYRICLDFSSVLSPGGSIMPTMGTYKADTEGMFTEGTFVPCLGVVNAGTIWQVPDGNGGAVYYPISDGFFRIRLTDDNKYQIFGTLTNEYGDDISFNYVGSLSFTNNSPRKLTELTMDFNMGEAYYANQKCTSTGETYDLWKLYIYNQDSWTSQGASGYFLSVEIPLEPGTRSIPAGEYKASAHVLQPENFDFIQGYIFAADTSLAAAYGSWLAQGTSPCAPICGGTLQLVQNSDNTYTVTFDLTDDDYIPKHITGSFSGKIPVI